MTPRAKAEQLPTAGGGEQERASGFELTLGHVLDAAQISPDDVLVIRHTYKEDGLRNAGALTPEVMRIYTRGQLVKPGKFPQNPPCWWVVFMAESGRRSRLFTVYENAGEVEAERTAVDRFYDLRETNLLDSLRRRLLVEWTKDTINWAKTGPRAWPLPVLEIADPSVVEFPGYDELVVEYATLQQAVVDPRYIKWQTALGAVQGIYVIADSVTGRLYVGKADGAERILGRWKAYAADGHGGNVALREALEEDPRAVHNYTFSLLRVFGPQTPQAEIDRAEAHYKRALLTRRPHGFNRN
ncbi:GIY-YIG nuclease family protein [Mobilicoccus sp.]|uniref:GIY-YIG nuclease family protein n=1 Tax=Mobilicoccus sp. TaxID=2034349 RepID=UPI0028A81440|nr:GIY-YIG nuclease family protein [Mobilicoccus sp.]